jgi:hypothetical protein
MIALDYRKSSGDCTINYRWNFHGGASANHLQMARLRVVRKDDDRRGFNHLIRSNI